jgi:hypothetical protein
MNRREMLKPGSLAAAGKRTEEIFYYMDFHQPVYYEFPLPEARFAAEMIDPWEMKVSAMPGTCGSVEPAYRCCENLVTA